MKQLRLGAALLASLAALAALAGSATAGNGNGNGNGNGQSNRSGQSNGSAAEPAAASASQPAGSSEAAQTAPPGQAKKDGASASTAEPPPAAASPPGVKPSPTTGRRTHCTVGANTTCRNGTPTSPPDASKRYGNGKTAAGIALSRGAPSGTRLTGPGNSQPHKVTACGKPSNKSGGVDVHAVKSYSAAGCTPPASAAPAEVTKHGSSTCASPGAAATIVGVMHVNAKGRGVHVMTNTHSAHLTGKHAHDYPVAVDEQPSSSGSCTAAEAGATVAATAPAPPVTPVVQTPAQAVVAAATHTTASAPSAAPAPANRSAAGGVLGAHVTLAKPGHRGVLGTVGRVAGTTLPFTGLALWIFALVAAALVAAGLALRARSHPSGR